MQEQKLRQPRPRGTGSLSIRRDKAGRETWYGKWRDADGRQVKRALGPKRLAGTRIGMTRSQAEASLRRAMETDRAASPPFLGPPLPLWAGGGPAAAAARDR